MPITLSGDFEALAISEIDNDDGLETLKKFSHPLLFSFLYTWNKKLELNLENFFENILANKLNTKNIKTIDGLGSKRISKIISNLFSENH